MAGRVAPLYFTTLCILLQICIEHQGQSTKVVYVSPSHDNTACPAQPCLTLSHLASSSGYFANDTDLSLIFLDGTHNLSHNFSIRNLRSISMEAYSSVDLPVIECQPYVSFHLANTDNVSLVRLKFVGCGGNMVLYVGHFRVQNSVFAGDEASGTVFDFYASNSDIVNCTFSSNRVGSYRGPIKVNSITGKIILLMWAGQLLPT